MQITLDLQPQITDAIVVASLKEDYKDIKEDIKTVKLTKQAMGIYSFDYKEEIKALKRHKNHIKYVLKYYNGSAKQ